MLWCRFVCQDNTLMVLTADNGGYVKGASMCLPYSPLSLLIDTVLSFYLQRLTANATPRHPTVLPVLTEKLAPPTTLFGAVGIVFV